MLIFRRTLYEGTSKRFLTFIFSPETVRAVGIVIGRVCECHVTSQSGKPADLAVQYESCHAVVKMAAELINCTKEEQRSVILFLWAEGVPGAQIHLRMCAQYGDNVPSVESSMSGLKCTKMAA
jgi:hypothetical protein